MEKIIVSVLMPVRNAEGFIFKSITSIINQTFSDFELIIINDGSTDKTVDIIKKIQDDRIVLLETNGIGLVAALNLGLSKAKGKYIARMDGDDISVKYRFSKQIEILDKFPEIGVVCTDAYIIDESDNIINIEQDKISSNSSLLDGLLYKKKYKPIIHPSVMMRIDLLKKVNGYRDYYAAEDRDLWFRLMEHTIFYRISEPLLYYRKNTLGISMSNILQQKISGMLCALNFLIYKEANYDIYIRDKGMLYNYEKYIRIFYEKYITSFEKFILLKLTFRKNLYSVSLFINIVQLLNFKIIYFWLFEGKKERKQLKKISSQFKNELGLNKSLL